MDIDIIAWDQETILEGYVRLRLMPVSAIPEGMQRIAEETRRAKRAES